MILKRRGFTFIEVLIVIAIVGVLASIVLASLSSAQVRARDASFKSTASSIQPGIIVCCDNLYSLDGMAPSDLICSSGDMSYPDSTVINTVTVDVDCQSDGTFQITVTPGTMNTGICTGAVITNEGAAFTGC